MKHLVCSAILLALLIAPAQGARHDYTQEDSPIEIQEHGSKIPPYLFVLPLERFRYPEVRQQRKEETHEPEDDDDENEFGLQSA